MSGGKISRDLSEDSVRSFYEEIQEILLSALPIDEAAIDADLTINQDSDIYLLNYKVPLYYGRGTLEPEEFDAATRSELYRLYLEFKLSWDRTGCFLAVEKSSYQIRVHTSPGVRFEYERNKYNAPAAHIHFSGVEGLLSPALMKNGPTRKGDSRKQGQLGALHIPVGGHRFRISVEDFLYFVIQECGFAGRTGWENKLKVSRDTWFDIQLQAAVRDNPNIAAQQLRELGFEVTEPSTGCPPRKRHQSW
ncbi:hypothetical protein [Corynebacterium kozikiae]|uniref:hypothetical protein n=1 Tax=Corynebacterium kozikiae TaxID=2968469 RepID=UPI00211C80BB|nr:hypothetical protein [Corynebacterium sp. 76QC2CO]MCQ9343489.1 hypothetical protein [Corynebacterium sp. 76QC2CO]